MPTLRLSHLGAEERRAGNIERPRLKRLLEDIDAGLVDTIVVYKIGRLTRSLADFARIVDRLDKAQASFVSVTQSFNTTTCERDRAARDAFSVSDYGQGTDRSGLFA